MTEQQLQGENAEYWAKKRREHLASMAMQGLARQLCPHLERNVADIIRDSLALADALIAALDAPKESPAP